MKDYDPSKASNFLTYIDAYNLYGWAMSQYLTFGGFRWSHAKIDVMSINDDSSRGYKLVRDLEYYKDLHGSHSDLPVALEDKIPGGLKKRKLLKPLYNKEWYVIHYKNLKQYLQLELKLTIVHRELEFEQSPWLKSIQI